MNKAYPMNQVQQRVLARKARSLVLCDGVTADAAAKAYGISRAHYYRLVNALEAFEANSADGENLREVDATTQLNIEQSRPYMCKCKFKCMCAKVEPTQEFMDYGNPERDPLCD